MLGNKNDVTASGKARAEDKAECQSILSSCQIWTFSNMLDLNGSSSARPKDQTMARPGAEHAFIKDRSTGPAT